MISRNIFCRLRTAGAMILLIGSSYTAFAKTGHSLPECDSIPLKASTIDEAISSDMIISKREDYYFRKALETLNPDYCSHLKEIDFSCFERLAVKKKDPTVCLLTKNEAAINGRPARLRSLMCVQTYAQNTADRNACAIKEFSKDEQKFCSRIFIRH